MTTTFLPHGSSHAPHTRLVPSSPGARRVAELRGWVLGLRDLRRDGIDVAVRGRTGIAGERSGERCLAIQTGPRRWLVGLVDARGPGADAADAAHALVSHLRRRAALRELPAILADANAFVRAHDRGLLVAASLLDVDAAHHSVRAAVAGGVAPLVAGRSGDVVALDAHGPGLGLVADPRWTIAGPLRLAPGHLLLAATDGVQDRVRDDGEAFGRVRVAGVLAACRADGPRAAARTAIRAACDWAPEDPSDLSALALRVR